MRIFIRARRGEKSANSDGSRCQTSLLLSCAVVLLTQIGQSDARPPLLSLLTLVYHGADRGAGISYLISCPPALQPLQHPTIHRLLHEIVIVIFSADVLGHFLLSVEYHCVTI